MAKKQYGFLIDPELARGLKLLKERDGVPESETIRRALTEYLRARGALPVEKGGRAQVKATRSRGGK